MGLRSGQKGILEESVAALIETNASETDPDEIEDNLKFISIGQEKLEEIRRIMPEV